MLSKRTNSSAVRKSEKVSIDHVPNGFCAYELVTFFEIFSFSQVALLVVMYCALEIKHSVEFPSRWKHVEP